jgi:peptide/nickel transport system substrate-binding protein
VADLPGQNEFAKRIKDSWEDRLDINITIRKVDPDKILTDVIQPRDYEILLYGQEVGRDPDRYVNWHSSQKDYPGINISGFEHIRSDRALEEGRNELTNEGRVVHYHEFQKVVSEQIPAIFLYHPFMNYYISKHIQGVGDKYTFTQYDRFMDFANWKRLETN